MLPTAGLQSGNLSDARIVTSHTVDKLTKAQRSALMSKIGNRNTKPEIAVRSMIHRLGYRFRLHRNDLPGRPDIILPRHEKIVFVHGCFWHGHRCRLSVMPKTNVAYWAEKITRNQKRDKKNVAALRRGGWRVLEIWECEIKLTPKLEKKLITFLEKP